MCVKENTQRSSDARAERRCPRSLEKDVSLPWERGHALGWREGRRLNVNKRHHLVLWQVQVQCIVGYFKTAKLALVWSYTTWPIRHKCKLPGEASIGCEQVLNAGLGWREEQDFFQGPADPQTSHQPVKPLDPQHESYGSQTKHFQQLFKWYLGIHTDNWQQYNFSYFWLKWFKLI